MPFSHWHFSSQLYVLREGRIPESYLQTNQLPANVLVLGSSILSTIIAIIAMGFQAALNNSAPHRDTLQTWTCRWRNVSGQGVPREFDTLCHETVSSTPAILSASNRHANMFFLSAFRILHHNPKLHHPTPTPRSSFLRPHCKKCQFSSKEAIAIETRRGEGPRTCAETTSVFRHQE